MTKKVFYEKVGRRYVPVSEYDHDLLGSLPMGDHLVSVYPGTRGTMFNVVPALAPMIAAGRFAENAIAQRIVDASAWRPLKAAVTTEQQQAWDNLKQAFDDEFFSIQSGSARDIAEAGVTAMQQEADRLLKNPALRAAYEHFMLLCELSMEHEE